MQSVEGSGLNFTDVVHAQVTEREGEKALSTYNLINKQLCERVESERFLLSFHEWKDNQVCVWERDSEREENEGG